MKHRQKMASQLMWTHLLVVLMEKIRLFIVINIALEFASTAVFNLYFGWNVDNLTGVIIFYHSCNIIAYFRLTP